DSCPWSQGGESSDPERTPKGRCGCACYGAASRCEPGGDDAGARIRVEQTRGDCWFNRDGGVNRAALQDTNKSSTYENFLSKTHGRSRARRGRRSSHEWLRGHGHRSK